MIYRTLLLLITSLAVAAAQPTCPDTPTYSPCDLVFELNDAAAGQHPKPHQTVELHAEFRSPEADTYLVNAFWDGGRRLVIRFAPLIPGRWDFRLTSNIARWDGQVASFNAVPSNSKGFVRVANTHHFSYTEADVRPIPHLWMGDTSYRFAVIDRAFFEQMVNKRAEQKFNHIRGLVFGNFPGVDAAYIDASTPNTDYFRELDSRIRYMNERGIVADLVLGGDRNHLAEFFPSWREREAYVRYIVARYAAMNVTWQGVQEFEEYEEGRRVLREIGNLIKKLDPYDHPRTTHTVATSAPLLPDGWMDYIAYQSSSDALGAIEHQLYSVPQVNTEFAYENSGAGASHDHHVDTDTFRKRLWNNTMNGQYPTYGNTGTYGGRRIEPSPEYLDAPGAEQMTHWYDFFSRTRHWELEPYFDVDGGRALALTGVEYIVYLEKPGPVELLTEKRKYDVWWFNPITGEALQIKKADKYKGERFSASPPDSEHDWVLHLSRDDQKESMLEKWHFASRPVLMQAVELNPKMLPYGLIEPSDGPIPAGKPVRFEVKLTSETRASRQMKYLLVGDVTGGAHGYRVLATGDRGEFRVPPGIVERLPANINLRLIGMNGLGKVYSLSRVLTLAE